MVIIVTSFHSVSYIFILKYAFKMNEIYLLRKCDIIPLCGIEICRELRGVRIYR